MWILPVLCLKGVTVGWHSFLVSQVWMFELHLIGKVSFLLNLYYWVSLFSRVCQNKPKGQVLRNSGCTPHVERSNWSVDLHQTDDEHNIYNTGDLSYFIIQPVLCKDSTLPLIWVDIKNIVLRQRHKLGVLMSSKLASHCIEFCGEAGGIAIHRFICELWKGFWDALQSRNTLLYVMYCTVELALNG